MAKNNFEGDPFNLNEKDVLSFTKEGSAPTDKRSILIDTSICETDLSVRKVLTGAVQAKAPNNKRQYLFIQKKLKNIMDASARYSEGKAPYLEFETQQNFYEYIILERIAKTNFGKPIDYMEVVNKGRSTYISFNTKEFNKVWNEIFNLMTRILP